jgi:putative membrane protein
MLGSLYSITQGATTLDTPQPAMTFSTFSIVFFIIGGVIILGLQLLKKFMNGKLPKEEVSTEN